MTPAIEHNRATRDAQVSNLFAAGYRASIHNGIVHVTNPQGDVYRVDLSRQTCSCPSSRRCKHLDGLRNLFLDQMAEYDMQSMNAMVYDGHTSRYTPRGMELRRRAVEMSEMAYDLLRLEETWTTQ